MHSPRFLRSLFEQELLTTDFATYQISPWKDESVCNLEWFDTSLERNT
jgi:hypothetical protein